VLNGLHLPGARAHAPGAIDLKAKLSQMQAASGAAAHLLPSSSPASKQAGKEGGGAGVRGVVELASVTLSPEVEAAGERSGALARARLKIEQGKARAWSAETPWMYTLVVSLLARGEGSERFEVVEVVRLRVGLRAVEVSEGRLRVNGRPVTLRGVNRHEHTPDKGHVVSVESMAHDIQLMKDFNFNCVRCSHYPADERFYQVCFIPALSFVFHFYFRALLALPG